jgi:hypothetical protein
MVRLCDTNTGDIVCVGGVNYVVYKKNGKIQGRKGSLRFEYGEKSKMWVELVAQTKKEKKKTLTDRLIDAITNTPKTTKEISNTLSCSTKTAGALLGYVRSILEIVKEYKNGSYTYCLYDETKNSFGYNKIDTYTNIGGHIKTIEKYSK